MLTVEEALERILSTVPVAGTEVVTLSEAHRRVLAADLVSPRDVPPFDNSAMDGYAVRAADTGPGEVELRLNETVGAGSVAAVRVEAGTATGIMTGAPVPPGADTVVMVERTDGARAGAVRVRGTCAVGDNIRRAGEDIRRGHTVLRAGAVLTPARVGLVASLGYPTVEVRRRPIVAILSTGDEVIDPGQPLGPGQIYSSNNVVLAGLVRQAGGIPRDHGNAPDDLDELVARLQACLDADVVVTTGGVSVGVYDYVKEAYGRIGAEMGFWKVAMKPGKPLAFGRVERDGRMIPLFGLPGNPVSCMVNFLQFVRPMLQSALGLPAAFLPVVAAELATAYASRPGRARLVRVTLEASDRGWVCRPTGTQSSGVLMSMALADGLMLLGPEVGSVEAGAQVRVQVIDAGFLASSTPAYGW